MDKICIRGLTIDAVIGVYDWERKILQRLLVDLEIATDIQPAAHADDLSLAVDYQKVCEQITQLVQARKAQLIETLAEDIANYLLTNFATQWVKVTVNKPHAIPEAQNISVVIERQRIE